MSAVRAQFEPLQEKFASLAKFDAAVPEPELAQLASLDATATAFDGTLDDSERMLAGAKAGMRNQLLSNLDGVEEHVEGLREESKAAMPYHEVSLDPKEALAIANKYKAACEETRAKLASMRDGLEVFGIEMPDPQPLKDTEKDVKLVGNIWSLLDEWAGKWENWRTGPWTS